MEKFQTLLIICLLILPVASAWENYNTIDFATDALNKTDCGSLNITEIINIESVNEPSSEKLRIYMNSSTSRCENFIRGAHHFFQLNDPQPSCLRFYPTVHQWWGLWNWRFFDCGVDFGKTDADRLVNIYATDFWTGELEVDKPIAQPDNTSSSEWDFNPTDTPYIDEFLGGGGIDFSRDLLWETWFVVPNFLWLELIFVFIAYALGGVLWKREEWSSVVGNLTNSPGKAILMSWNKKFSYWLIIFIVVNIIFWFAFFTIK